MGLYESIKKAFLPKEYEFKPTSITPDDKLDYPVAKTDTDEVIPIGFSDSTDETNNYFITQTHKKWASLVKQKLLIESYRKAADTVEVGDAIDDIINEASFSEQRDSVIKLDINEDNARIKDALQEEFKNVVTNVLDLDNTIYQLMERFYIDGQLNVKLVYNKNKITEGIKSIDVISPFYFYYNTEDKKWHYLDVMLDDKHYVRSLSVNKDIEYNKEEIIRIDSGIYNTEDKVILSWLNKAIKTSNQLRTLEDLLIPMRFSRSVSRRVFNVDVGDLTPTKADKFLRETKNEFKYKKQYNTDTGEIKNNQHIASMVEDYWFANRSGAKGTQVDVLDETGNLGELADLIYFQKKIYRAMRVPSSRTLKENDNPTFGPNNEEITQEELKFFLFVSRFRKRFLKLITAVFKRNVISKGILSTQEYIKYQDKMNIYFTSENKFFKKMKQMELMNQADIYGTIKEDIGTIYSYKSIFQDVFDMTEEDMIDRIKEIQKEKGNKLTKDLYTTPEEY